MNRLTAIELEAETDRAKARRFFMGWLIAATVVSVGGNAAHAVLEWLPAVGVKIAVACLPPVVALVGIHGVAVLARSGHTARARASAPGGRVYGLSVAVTGLLALGAAILSFAGLHGLAIAGGIDPHLAALWPITVDAGIAVSTVALVVLRPTSAADLRAARAVAAPLAVQTSAPADCAAPAVPAAPAPRPAPAPRHRAPVRPALQTVPATAVHACEDTAAIAQALVDGGATTKSLEQVQQVLEAHAAGAAITRIATHVGVHHATVRKIINAASGYRQLATVG